MHCKIRECQPAELPGIIERLDQEFVFNKQRSLSLSKRFSNTLSLANIEHILVAESEGVVTGTLSIRRFEWIADERPWHGAMLGMLWVDPQSRGKRIAPHLLASASNTLRERHVDFGVLWTSIPRFYERIGWVSSSGGLFGEAADRPRVALGDTVSRRPLDTVDVNWLEHLRSRSLPMRVVRSAIDYRTVPIPATQVLCLSAQASDGKEGFALVGEHEGTGYFYEMVAPPSLWSVIWSALIQRFDRLYVNGHSADPFTQWLAEHRFVIWQPQSKTMWLRLSDRLENSLLRAWHVPYFDWM